MLPDLNPGGGIAFVASVRLSRLAQSLCYGPGKAALIHFAECLHLDLAPGASAWAINPGFVSPAHRQERFRHARPANARAGRRLSSPALPKGISKFTFPKRFTLPARFLPSRLPLVLPLIRRFTGG